MKRFVLLVFLVFLSSCASTPKQENWPAEIPAYNYFLEQYEDDLANSREQSFDTYLGWVRNFYYGFLVANRGWLKISKETKELIEDPVENKMVQDKLYLVGKKISAEWAKSKKTQRINTRLLGIWGNSLQEAIDRNEASAYVDKVLDDVEALLDGQLLAKDIGNYRYFPETDDFFF